VVGVGERPARARRPGEAILLVVGVGRGAGGVGLFDQVAFVVVGVGRAADAGVLVEVVGGIGGGHAVVGHRRPVAGGVVLVHDGPGVGQGDGRQLAGGVIVVGRHAVEGGHRLRQAQRVVGVIEAGVNRSVGSLVYQVQHLAGGVVVVGRGCAIAQVLARELAHRVVAVLDDELVAAVEQLRQAADAVVLVVDGETGLVHALLALPQRVVGEVQRAAVGVGDVGDFIGEARVGVGEGDGARGIPGRLQVA